ncbi:MAG: archaeosortase/exosortase family protein, partial [Sphingomonadaceae bacterium]|nr:archaeosortase/exosortase family protein [Sphingomonadaceae bacterium]
FLVAMIALGALVANVCFTSWRRRTAFMAACVIVPILANGVRAFATIFVAQKVGVEAAVGFDHIVYGWFFFAIVVAAVLAGSWRFFDRPANDPMIDADTLNASPFLGRLSALHAGMLPALAALALLITGAQVWVRAGNAITAELPEQIMLPDVKAGTSSSIRRDWPGILSQKGLSIACSVGTGAKRGERWMSLLRSILRKEKAVRPAVSGRGL